MLSWASILTARPCPPSWQALRWLPWPAPGQLAAILTGVLAAAGPVVWNAVLRATPASQFFTDTPDLSDHRRCRRRLVSWYSEWLVMLSELPDLTLLRHPRSGPIGPWVWHHQASTAVEMAGRELPGRLSHPGGSVRQR
jgi:hypothetical protein